MVHTCPASSQVLDANTAEEAVAAPSSSSGERLCRRRNSSWGRLCPPRGPSSRLPCLSPMCEPSHGHQPCQRRSWRPWSWPARGLDQHVPGIRDNELEVGHRWTSSSARSGCDRSTLPSIKHSYFQKKQEMGKIH